MRFAPFARITERAKMAISVVSGMKTRIEHHHKPVVVHAVVLSDVYLPCRRAPIFTLIFIYGGKSTIYNVDFRSGGLGSRYPSPELLGGRATLIGGDDQSRWDLIVEDVRTEDAGIYRCRLDFQAAPTHNTHLKLAVVDLPESVHLRSSGGTDVDEVLSVQEGRPIKLRCTAYGGSPPPSVRWYIGSQLLDDEMYTNHDGNQNFSTHNTVTNILNIEKVKSSYFHRNLSCQVSNNPEMPSLAAVVILVPSGDSLDVSLTVEPASVRERGIIHAQCQATGVMPPPTLTWALRGRTLTQHANMSVSGAWRVSHISLSTTSADDGADLECLAQAPSLPHLTNRTQRRITVTYVPVVSLIVREPPFEEGGSATLTCNAKANPSVYSTTFMFNGKRFLREGIVKSSNSTLTLLNLSHQDAGLYTCIGANTEGDGQSNAVLLKIDYRPVCAYSDVQEVTALEDQEVKLICSSKASPPTNSFAWWTMSPNGTTQDAGDEADPNVVQEETESGVTSSVGWVRAVNMTQVSCQPTNILGSARRPCTFILKVVDLPSAVFGCISSVITSDSAFITCSPGLDVGLKQHFHIEVREQNSSSEVIHGSISSDQPQFLVSELAPSRTYMVAVWAQHSLGRGPTTSLIIKTMGPQIEQLGPEMAKDSSAVGSMVPATVSRDTSSTLLDAPLGVFVVVGIMGSAMVAIGGLIAMTAYKCGRRKPTSRKQSDDSSAAAAARRNTSNTSLLDQLKNTASYHACADTEPRDLQTTFAPGPVFETKVALDSISAASLSFSKSRNKGSSFTHATLPWFKFRSKGGHAQVIDLDIDNDCDDSTEVLFYILIGMLITYIRTLKMRKIMNVHIHQL
ncbi:unnamed protein product [Meganyctiphanes norvegica]|uniref:Nephrin/kirre n=1 Tax=Meganyctiphanes norvegica TaxID=48144 RepID=A0AAV2PXF1_MEGNR